MGEFLDQTEHYTLYQHKQPEGYVVLEVRGPNGERNFSLPIEVYERDLSSLIKSGIMYIDHRTTVTFTHNGEVVLAP